MKNFFTLKLSKETVNFKVFINKGFLIYRSFLKELFAFQSILKEMINFKLFINREDLISI